MSLESELEEQLRTVNIRARDEASLGSRVFTRQLNKLGGVGAAKHLLAPYPDAGAQAGFQQLMHVGCFDLTMEFVVLQPHFRTLFTTEELLEARRRLGWTENPTISAITEEIERLAPNHPIGRLQEIRQRLKQMSRLPSRRIFGADTIFDNYAYHRGGRTELQFNIGIEALEDGRNHLRHGVAISLERSPSFHEIDDTTLTRVERFNEFLRTYSASFADFQMYWDAGNNDWSGDYTVRPITQDMVRLGIFIFVGRRQPLSGVSAELILNDFDRLLPFYEFVEGRDDFPALAPRRTGFVWSPGNKARTTRTAYSRAAQIVDKELRHNVLQDALFKHLSAIHGKDNVSGEQDCGNGTLIDVAIRTKAGYFYYEIKTAMSTRLCIREALGQLMEYSYWPGTQQAGKLIIVGEPPLDPDGRKYLSTLCMQFKVPVHYQQFDMVTGTLAV